MGQADLEVIDFLRVLLNNENAGVCSGRERKVQHGATLGFSSIWSSLTKSHYFSSAFLISAMPSDGPCHLFSSVLSFCSLPLTDPGPCLEMTLFQILVQGLELVYVQMYAPWEICEIPDELPQQVGMNFKNCKSSVRKSNLHFRSNRFNSQVVPPRPHPPGGWKCNSEKTHSWHVILIPLKILSPALSLAAR